MIEFRDQRHLFPLFLLPDKFVEVRNASTLHERLLKVHFRVAREMNFKFEMMQDPRVDVSAG